MRIGAVVVLAWGLLGAVAPWLANDVPIVARADGVLRWPVAERLTDGFSEAPGARRWKDWWAELPVDASGGDWAVMPPWTYGPGEVLPGQALDRPSASHPLGVDDAGRDQLARLLHGASTAFLVAFGSVLLSSCVGCVIGGLAGMRGARSVTDVVATRGIEVFTCFPAVLALLAGATYLGPGLPTVVAVLAAVQWPVFARVVRGELLSLRERPFVEAARGLGEGPLRILRRHLLPELRGPVLVAAAMVAAEAILAESTLTFLGLGLGLGSVSWGAMLDQGRAQAYAGAWHLWLFPALALASAVIALYALADAWRARPALTRPASAVPVRAPGAACSAAAPDRGDRGRRATS
ncbi:MAG: ABC transporter permease [Planctomycetes bacterium]|nr:ABC transporter permease [Planctomycetota bacterium]